MFWRAGLPEAGLPHVIDSFFSSPPWEPAGPRRCGLAIWFIDTDYNEESFFVRHAYFLGQNNPYGALTTTLKAEIDPDVWASLNSAISRPFPVPTNRRFAVKVINHLGDEVMKVFRVQ